MWSSVVLVSVQHGVPGPGPEGAEGDGPAHQPHLQILAKIDRGFGRGFMSK